MARTPPSKIIDTIEAVEVIIGQIENLTAALEKLEKRVTDLEKAKAT